MRDLSELEIEQVYGAGGKGRNPQTGEEITIKPSKQPRFRAGKQLKDSLN